MAQLVTITDIEDKVAATLEGTTFDVDAIADELRRTYDIVGPTPTMTFDDIDTDEYWAIVEKHDNGDRTVTISALNPTTQVWEVIEREPAKGKMIVAVDAVELVAEDFGGVVGATYRVEIRDPEDNVLRHADVVAR